jgi:hypothetical protein
MIILCRIIYAIPESIQVYNKVVNHAN